MKKTALTLLGVFALSQLAVAQTTSAAPAAMIPATLKPATILVVDVGEVVNNYSVAVAFNVRFQGIYDDANATFATMNNDLVSIAKDAQADSDKINNAATSAADKAAATKDLDAKKADFQAKQNALASYKQSKESDLSNYRLKVTQALLENVKNVINDVAKKHGAMFVLNSNGINSVLYSSADYDATQEVLSALNAAASTVQVPAPPTTAMPTATKPAAGTATSTK